MSLPESPKTDAHWFDRMTTVVANSSARRLDRRSLGGLGLTALIGGAVLGPLRGSVKALQPRDSGAVLNDAATLEGLLVTFLGVARTRSTELAL